MTALKEFFAAGLAVEEAFEVKDQAGEVLRVACVEKCPDELSAYDKTKQSLEDAKNHFRDVWMRLATGDQSMSHQMLHARGMDCGDDKCPFKPTTPKADSDKMN